MISRSKFIFTAFSLGILLLLYLSSKYEWAALPAALSLLAVGLLLTTVLLYTGFANRHACRACGYTLSGISNALCCPECGLIQPRRLTFRLACIRLLPRPAAVLLATLALCYILLFSYSFRQVGIVAYIPDRVLVLAMPYIPVSWLESGGKSTSANMRGALCSRILTGQLSQGEIVRVLNCSASSYSPSGDRDANVHWKALVEASALRIIQLSHQGERSHENNLSDLDKYALYDLMASIVRDTEDRIRGEGSESLGTGEHSVLNDNIEIYATLSQLFQSLSSPGELILSCSGKNWTESISNIQRNHLAESFAKYVLQKGALVEAVPWLYQMLQDLGYSTGLSNIFLIDNATDNAMIEPEDAHRLYYHYFASSCKDAMLEYLRVAIGWLDSPRPLTRLYAYTMLQTVGEEGGDFASRLVQDNDVARVLYVSFSKERCWYQHPMLPYETGLQYAALAAIFSCDRDGVYLSRSTKEYLAYNDRLPPLPVWAISNPPPNYEDALISVFWWLAAQNNYFVDQWILENLPSPEDHEVPASYNEIRNTVASRY